MNVSFCRSRNFFASQLSYKTVNFRSSAARTRDVVDEYQNHKVLFCEDARTAKMPNRALQLDANCDRPVSDRRGSVLDNVLPAIDNWVEGLRRGGQFHEHIDV
jgi:hypothetical protein